MQRILIFLVKNYFFLVFVVLFSIGMGLTIQSHSYHHTRIVNSTNWLVGGFYSVSESVSKYFNLKQQNIILSEENRTLREALFNLKTKFNTQNIDTFNIDKNFKVRKALVIKNSYTTPNNHLLLNKGEKDGVSEDLGVISSRGIVGIIEKTSINYSNTLSIISKKSKINAKLKSCNHFGSIEWNEKSAKYVQFTDVSIFAPVKVGDTVVTGGQSVIFPKDINIGVVTSFKTDVTKNNYEIEVKLFNDMANLDTVYIIERVDKLEIRDLLNSTDE